MTNDTQQKHGNTMNTFLLGALIGGGLVLLFTTDKGRKLLRSLTENGLDNITDLGENLVKKYIPLDEEDLEEKQESEERKPVKPAATTEKTKTVRKFFRKS